MRSIFIFLLLIPTLQIQSQKIALLDVNLVKPILFTDSITVQQTTSGYFPVEVENFDSLYANLNYIKNMLNTRKRSKMQSFELRAGSTIITVKRVPFAYGDRYTSIASTKIKELRSDYLLTSIEKNNSANMFKVDILMSYMKNNKELFKAPNEITPKIYNVVTITQ